MHEPARRWLSRRCSTLWCVARFEPAENLNCRAISHDGNDKTTLRDVTRCHFAMIARARPTHFDARAVEIGHGVHIDAK